ncbi:BtrH N-terminal domain-containing protein [Chryseolinea lacunae]|uniref:BtrH N-terminal domain-containing protein n=1 Tax=Chryseolinea lacunae TaxID=2801331 RepID=A0ABS1KNL8_9BACT|nr:BtrH N-terminal domain-containing protein [Chryseolinea lacunae]MBL0740852.1 BtrH N-terminal domain-containing protein [Chryseolinea lacunae]
MIVDFTHKQSAHCENGVVSNLLRFHGMEFDEPLVFGIGSGLFFSYLPFIRVNSIPVVAYRIWPGQIFKRFSDRIGIRVERHKFSSTEKAMTELDKMLDKGQPVGMLTSVYYLDYLPAAYRFHFNAHNIIVFGKKDGRYLVSDPVMEYTTDISYEDLVRARFAKGMPEPSGRMYYPVTVPGDFELNKAIWTGIKQTSEHMTRIPMPLVGSKGMKYMAKRLRRWPERVGDRKAILWLGNVIRMQEEIGTGGAGFRFIYAAFLDQASQRTGNQQLFDLSQRLTKSGDALRDFAYYAGRVCKNRKSDTKTFVELGDMLEECARQEHAIFNDLYDVSRSK